MEQYVLMFILIFRSSSVADHIYFDTYEKCQIVKQNLIEEFDHVLGPGIYAHCIKTKG